MGTLVVGGIDVHVGLGEPFISKEERPAVGEGALRQPKDPEPDKKQG